VVCTALGARTLVTGGLHYPVRDGIGRGLELPCQLLGRLPAAHQLYEPVPELGRVCTTCLGHGDLLASSEDRCPPNRVNSRGDLAERVATRARRAQVITR